MWGGKREKGSVLHCEVGIKMHSFAYRLLPDRARALVPQGAYFYPRVLPTSYLLHARTPIAKVRMSADVKAPAHMVERSSVRQAHLVKRTCELIPSLGPQKRARVLSALGDLYMYHE